MDHKVEQIPLEGSGGHVRSPLLLVGGRWFVHPDRRLGPAEQHRLVGRRHADEAQMIPSENRCA